MAYDKAFEWRFVGPLIRYFGSFPVKHPIDTSKRLFKESLRSRFERQLQVTDEVLAEIGADEVPRTRVFNKIDHVGDAAAQAECAAALRARYPDCVVMSARQPEDVAELRRSIVTFFRKDLLEAELFLPWSAAQLRGEIYAS